MALIIPEVKHEYIFMELSEQDKELLFNLCRADNKEAAYACFGTGLLDSEYLPSPTTDPDYMMDYCSTDGHDYLKDYRLIWGYGIGIIEQDVICSLVTGEHLAEGTEACDIYAELNALGENVDWKRGKWVKFSGNRNISPTRIGEVVLPDNIISLKDLCVSLNLTSSCDFYLPIETGDSILNISNLCGTKTNNPITICLNSEENIAPFTNALDCSYAFAYTDARVIQEVPLSSYTKSHMFYHANVGQIVSVSNEESCDYASMFENAIGDGESIIEVNYIDKAMFKNASNIPIYFNSDTIICKQDVSECFRGCKIYSDITSIDFSEATKALYMFYDTTYNGDELTINISTIQNHEEKNFSYFFKSDFVGVINIIAPEAKFNDTNVFTTSNDINTEINITNTLKTYEPFDDLSNLTYSNGFTSQYLIGNRENITALIKAEYLPKINGRFSGICIIQGIPTNSNNNIIITTDYTNYNYDTFIERLDGWNDKLFPSIFNCCFDSNDTFNGNLIFDNCILPNNISVLTTNYQNNNFINTTFNIDAKSKNIILFNKTSSNYDIEIDNDTNIKIIDYPYTYRYTNTYNGLINIIKAENVINEINYDRVSYSNTLIDGYITINCNGLNVNFNVKNNAQKSIRNLSIGLKNVNELVLNKNSLNSVDINANTNRIYIENCNLIKANYYDKDTPSRFGDLNISYSGENALNIKSNCILSASYIYGGEYNFIPIDTISRLTGHKYLQDGSHNLYPILSHENGDNFYTTLFYNYAENYDLNNLYKEIFFINVNNARRYITRRIWVVNQTINKEIESKIINLYNNEIEAVYHKIFVTNSLKDYEIIFGNGTNDTNLYNGALYINLNDTSGEPSITIGQIKKITLKRWHENKNVYIHKLTGSLEINLTSNNYSGGSYGVNTYRIYNDNTLSSLILSFNNAEEGGRNCFVNNVVVEIDITNITINVFTTGSYKGIKKSLDLSLCSSLDQESINNIVNPDNFVSGCTLTIHTTPFQYITEEQKQALVDAGVTLVEYIPTE